MTFSPEKNGRWLPLLLPTLIAVAGISGTWAVYGERIEIAKEVRAELRADLDANGTEHQNFVTKEILNLTLNPMQRDIEYIKQAIQRIERNWDIMKRQKAKDDEPPGAHGQ